MTNECLLKAVDHALANRPLAGVDLPGNRNPLQRLPADLRAELESDPAMLQEFFCHCWLAEKADCLLPEFSHALPTPGFVDRVMAATEIPISIPELAGKTISRLGRKSKGMTVWYWATALAACLVAGVWLAVNNFGGFRRDGIMQNHAVAQNSAAKSAVETPLGSSQLNPSNPSNPKVASNLVKTTAPLPPEVIARLAMGVPKVPVTDVFETLTDAVTDLPARRRNLPFPISSQKIAEPEFRGAWAKPAQQFASTGKSLREGFEPLGSSVTSAFGFLRDLAPRERTSL